MGKIYLVLAFLIYSFGSFSQVTSQLADDQYVFLKQGEYKGKVREEIEKNIQIKNIELFTRGTVLTNNKVSYSKLLRHIELRYPDKDVEGIACFDLENSSYHDIKNYDESDARFQSSIDEFIGLLRFFKKHRPNVKIGFYGIPYKMTSEKHVKYNTDKLDRLLAESDVIFPSLYLSYSFNERRSSSYSSYIETNLKSALEYGRKLGKPVVPFTWYMIHPSNRLHGGELVSKAEYDNYLRDILGFVHQGNKVAGVVYWDSSYSYFKNSIRKTSPIIQERNLKIDGHLQNELIDIYLLR